MPDATTTTGKTVLQIPEETVKQFPDLVELIKISHSMDDEERQYWVDVLPIMSEDQIKNLRDILSNEKKQIEDANQSYAKGMGQVVQKTTLIFDEIKYKEKKQARINAEQVSEKEETTQEEAVLKELGNL